VKLEKTFLQVKMAVKGICYLQDFAIVKFITFNSYRTC